MLFPLNNQFDNDFDQINETDKDVNIPEQIVTRSSNKAKTQIEASEELMGETEEEQESDEDELKGLSPIHLEQMLKTKHYEPDHQLQVSNHSEIGIEHDESVRENQPDIDFRRENQDRSGVYTESNVP